MRDCDAASAKSLIDAMTLSGMPLPQSLLLPIVSLFSWLGMLEAADAAITSSPRTNKARTYLWEECHEGDIFRVLPLH